MEVGNCLKSSGVMVWGSERLCSGQPFESGSDSDDEEEEGEEEEIYDQVCFVVPTSS